MSMNKTEQFDFAIRESTANFELPFSEAAWDLMDKKLDKELNSNSKKRFGFWWFSLCTIAIIGGSATYYFSTHKSAQQNNFSINTIYNTNNNSKQNNIDNANAATTAVEDTTRNNNQLKNNNNNTLTGQNDEVNTSRNKANTFHLSKKSDETSLSTNSKKENIFQPKTAAANNFDDMNKTSKNSSVLIPKNASSDVAKFSKTTITSSNAENIIKNLKDNNAALNSIKRMTSYASNQMHGKYLSSYKLAESAAAKIAKPDMTLYETAMPKLLAVPPIIPLQNRWYIGLNVGGNISYSSKPRLADTKLIFNFLVGYNIDNQLSIQTGLGYGNKQFDVKNDEFYYSGTNFLWSKYIRDCYVNMDVWELPISVSYQFSKKPNSGLFCTAGFSSLFFRKENYTINLDWGGTTVDKPWNFDNGQTILTMFNASIGYQFPLNKYYTLTAQQLIQLPTTRVGGAQMYMSSTALQVGIKYNFIRKK